MHYSTTLHKSNADTNNWWALPTLAAWWWGLATFVEDTYLPGNPQCVVKQLKLSGNQSVDITGSETFIDTEAQVLYQLESRSDSTTFSLLRGKSRILVQEFIKGCDLS